MSSTDSTKPDDHKKDPPPSPKGEETESAEEISKKRGNEEVSNRSATDSIEKEGDVNASADTTASTITTNVGAEAKATTAAGAAASAANEESTEPSPPKKAKIAIMSPAAAAAVAAACKDDVDEYTLDAPPTSENTDDAKIDSPNIILFGLHPLVKESPLRKMCEQYGTVQTIAVKSAFSSRYGHVEFATVDQAKKAYNALNGASLLQKQILVQPTKGQA
jgi:RNA recognition motif. (a.k.a. RRM, RBD, or RNP domain)